MVAPGLPRPTTVYAYAVRRTSLVWLGMQFDALTVFGLFAVATMMVFYAVEHRSAWFILAFAASCVLASIYGFLQGAWPFGVVESVWSLIALRRWATQR